MILRPRYFDMVEKYAYYTPGAHLSQGLLDLLSAGWISSAQNPAQWVARSNCPPFVTAGQRPVFVSDEDALKGITSDGFDSRAMVYLPNSSTQLVNVTNRTECAVLSTRFSGSRVDVSVNAAAESLVVVSQSFYHLWEASVDGQPTPLLRADLAFQAVQVPSGQHRVSFVYRDPNLKVGALVSFCALIACGLICFRKRRLEPAETK
jgi:hypothetical protein